MFRGGFRPESGKHRPGIRPNFEIRLILGGPGRNLALDASSLDAQLGIFGSPVRMVWSQAKGDWDFFGDACGVINTAGRGATRFKEALAKDAQEPPLSGPAVLTGGAVYRTAGRSLACLQPLMPA